MVSLSPSPRWLFFDVLCFWSLGCWPSHTLPVHQGLLKYLLQGLWSLIARCWIVALALDKVDTRRCFSVAYCLTGLVFGSLVARFSLASRSVLGAYSTIWLFCPSFECIGVWMLFGSLMLGLKLMTWKLSHSLSWSVRVVGNKVA